MLGTSGESADATAADGSDGSDDVGRGATEGIGAVVVGADVWEEFLHKTKNSGRLPHARVEVIKAGESTPAAGRTFSTLRLPNATTVAIDKLVEAVLFGRIARVD